MFWGKNIYDNDKCINIYGFVILHVRDLFEKDFRKFWKFENTERKGMVRGANPSKRDPECVNTNPFIL